MRKIFLIAAMIGLSAPAVAFAQQRVTVQFPAGNDNTYIEGTVKGGRYVDYMVNVRKGQRLGVSLITKASCYFNILEPNSTGVAVYNSSIDGNDGSITTRRNGNYIVRVYLMGADDDSSHSRKFALSISAM